MPRVVSPKLIEAGKQTRFKPGQSGNPGGKPKHEREIVDYARANALKAMRALVKVIDSATARPSEIAVAAREILDRAYGRPKQSTEHTFRGTIKDLTDAELHAIISGSGDISAADGDGEPQRVH